MIYRTTVVIAVGVLGLTAAGAGPDFSLWGSLQPGPYPVGFQSRWEWDAGRVYDIEFADGTRYANGKSPRPILVNLWYPAVLTDETAAPRMPHRAYLDLPAPEPRLARLSKELGDYARGVIAQWTLNRKPEDRNDWDRQEVERLLATATACVRNAPRAPGRFPLLVYHSGYGSSFEDNSVLCEYLASHGYVVAGSAFLAEEGESLNIDGGAGSARDFAFLIQTLAKAPNVDWHKIGIAGHSGGAHASLAFQAEPMAAVDAVISLDTTQDYVSALDPHWNHSKKVLDDITHQSAPLLVVARPHAFFQVCDALVHAERYYLTFRDLDHNDYTSQGVMASEVAARRARVQSDEDAEELRSRARVVRRGFEECCEYERLFLDAHLKQDRPAREKLKTLYRSTPFAGAEPHVEYVPRGTDQPEPYDPKNAAPPTPRQLFALLEAPGAKTTLEVLKRHHSETPKAPIYETQFAYAVLYDLVARGKTDQAAILAPFFGELHPKLVDLFLWWAHRSTGDRYRDFRRSALSAAKLIDPEHPDVAKGLKEFGAGGL